jgi:hypothetical protein
MLSPGKWWPFEIYLTVLWNALIFYHILLGFLSIKSDDFFAKAKEALFYQDINTRND